jgi:PAS domain S-box-containing protein
MAADPEGRPQVADRASRGGGSLGKDTGKPLSVLLIEDVADDELLIRLELRRGGYTVDLVRVDTSSAMSQALASVRRWDVVIASFSMPGFDGMDALRLLQAQGLDIPFIIVSGKIDEDRAIEALRQGAGDFMSKDRLARLSPAIEREMHNAAFRADQAQNRKRLEVQARQSEQQFRGLFEFAPDGLVITDGAGTIGLTNRKADAIFGYAPGELIGQPFDRLVAAATHGDRTGKTGDTPIGGIPLAISGGRTDLLGRKKDGSTFPIDISVGLMQSSGNQALIAAISDVTDRERAEQVRAEALAEVRAIHDQLDALLNCAPSMILAVDRSGRIQFINQVLPHLTREEVIGADWLPFIAPEDREVMLARFRRVVETGEPLTYETSTMIPAGGRRWFSAHMGAIRHGDAIVGAVIVANDVTETRVAQMEAAAAQRLAAMGTLAAGIAHEINTPIQFVGDSVAFLRTAAGDLLEALAQHQAVHRLIDGHDPAAPLPPELYQAVRAATVAEQEADVAYLRENVPAALERCAEGLTRVSAIVNAMKEFSHPAHREMAPVDLNRAIQNTLTVARGEYKYVADLKTDLDELPPVVCHVNEINQVVLNLVVNAAHSIGDVVAGSEGRGTITVRTRVEGEHVVITVADTGAGIPEAIRDRIFTPFFTTKEVGKGTGQGLALAWNVIKERHRGELTFETEVGRGTTFSVRLPCGAAPTS